MTSKLNTSFLNQYSASIAEKVCNDFFKNQPSASGQHILDLTQIPQVNLFVMESLYEKWKADTLAFKSPCFDFENTEVKTALQTFMNVVSRHISLKREHLEPLLASATNKTLSLLFDTQYHFNDIFRSQPNFTVTSETIKQLGKYIRFNQFVAKTVETKMGDRDFVYANEAITWAEDSIKMSAYQLERVDKWVAVFSEILPLNTDELLKQQYINYQVSENQQEKSFFDSVSPEVKEVNIPTLDISTAPEPTVNKAVEPEVSLNDTLKSEVESMAEKMQNRPISNLINNMPLHQKFMFTQQLFRGSNKNYEDAMTELNQLPNYEYAYQHIIYSLAGKHGWDITNEVVQELIDIVKRRYT